MSLLRGFRMTQRWSGMDSNFQFRARQATVSRLRPSPSGVDPPTARRSHPTSLPASRQTDRVVGRRSEKRHSPPNQVASPRAALSARRAHRFGWIDVLNLPSLWERAAIAQSSGSSCSRMRLAGCHFQLCTRGDISTLRRTISLIKHCPKVRSQLVFGGYYWKMYRKWLSWITRDWNHDAKVACRNCAEPQPLEAKGKWLSPYWRVGRCHRAAGQEHLALER